MGVLSSGTFRLVAKSFTSLTGPWQTWRGNVGAPGGGHFAGLTVTGTTDVDTITASDWTAASSSASSRAIGAGATGVNNGPYDFQVTFDDDLIFLNADVIPTARIDLPSGFTPSAAVVVASVKSLIAAPLSSVFLHFIPPRQSGALGPTGGLSFAWALPPAVPKILNLIGDGAGLRIEFLEDPLPGALMVDLFHLTGTYDVVAWWWLLPETTECGEKNSEPHLVLATEQPPTPSGAYGEFEKLDPNDPEAFPQPVITALNPSHGQAGITVDIFGEGFGDDANVQFDGVDAEDIVVVSSLRISCRVPAHALGFANVAVINVDGVSS